MKLLAWIQNKLSGFKNPKTVPSHSNVKPESASEEEFSDWPQGLFAIGTLGNEKSTENPGSKIIPQQGNTSSSPSTQYLTPGEIGSIQELISLLGEQEESDLPEELKEFSEGLLEESNGAVGGSLQCTTKWRDQHFDGSKIVFIRNRPLSFLLKKIFFCRSGFPPIPSLRDPPPEPRIEKILRALIKKKIYPHHGSPQALLTKKRCLENNVQISEVSAKENKANEEASPESKWDRTDSECASHPSVYRIFYPLATADQ